MSDETEDILIEFVQESRDHLAAIEPDLLELERQGEQAAPEVVNRIFRAIHSTKGGASFLAFDALKRFSHAMENVLMLVREQRLTPTSTVVDLLLRGVDVLKAMVDDVQNSDHVPCERELQELNAVLAGTKSQAPAPSRAVAPTTGSKTKAPHAQPQPPTPTDISELNVTEELGEQIVRELNAAGKLLYQVQYASGRRGGSDSSCVDDLVSAVNSVGECLRLRRERSDVEERFTILCASVLEKHLLAEALKFESGVTITEILLPGHSAKAALPHGPATSDARATKSAPSPTERLEVQQTPASAGPFEPDRARKTAEPPVDELPAPSSTFEVSANDKGTTRAPSNVEGQETLRVRVDLLTRLMNVAGELVLGRNQLLRLLRESADGVPGLVTILQHVDRVTTELQEGIMQTRMQPVNTLFARYARMVRDLGRQLGKRIELETTGNEVELDKSIIEALADPLTHVVRNAIDHGIEKPDERARTGKPGAGHIRIAAFHESGQVYIVVSDDGRGVDRAKVRKKAVEKHLVSQAESTTLSDHEVMNLLLMPGFSTAEQVTELSGRGVGMDVVRTNVEKLGGHVELDSVEHVGTTVRLRLPLTLAIIPSLIVRVNDARYAVPQVNIVELVWIRAADVRDRVESVQGAPVLRLRGKLLPLVHLSHLMRSRNRAGDTGQTSAGDQIAHPMEDLSAGNLDLSVVVMRAGNMRFGVLVDELFEWEEIVVKPVPSHLMDIGAFAGTTILGDGRVIMILDPGGIAKLADLAVSNSVSETAERSKQDKKDADHHSVILFSSAPGEQFAVPQDRVLRLERIEPKQLETIGGRDYVKYRGQGLPVIRLDACYPVSSVPEDVDELFLIIPRHESSERAGVPTGGILVWRILDALDVNVVLTRPMFSGPGVTGSAIIDGTLTMFMDPSKLLEWAMETRGAT